MPISVDGLSKGKKKPMNIKWELNEPLLYHLWKEAAKLRVG